MLYYYGMQDEDDESGCKGYVRAVDIDKIKIVDKANEHRFTIDAGPKKYEFIAPARFVCEKWVEALELSKKTAKIKKYSITGNVKNISKIVTLYELDRDELRDDIEVEVDDKLNENEFDDIMELLEVCTVIRDDMIMIFDACLAETKPRHDIIEMYMDTTHTLLCSRLSEEWEKRAFDLNPIETLSLIDWMDIYCTSLQKFGVSDDSIMNGFITLCNAYKRKIHMQLYPMISNVLMKERDSKPYEDDRE